ncbi:hypothetical protein NEFER03_2198 [Nematocida sp. LUAm3]|nr:hypothetical protein NEPAR08_2491 [Nematocida parisii]KAI5139057.1 hypothetical protein NEAUS07_2584 [Nematocida ausubeli]KAI5173251.1 hypothetical protein NEFER03_2198 [Nematocida sp. LUAm3]KAI5176455.1 hypothetical protein NEFER02_2210 [Nematocida sp. LUAm2]KAI5176464.1 hypothetical protein NEFER02_2216 [Nematocida sp. LUAm2]
MLQGISTKDTSTSAIVVEDLYTDEHTFISMVTAYVASLKKDGAQAEGDRPARQVLEVESLRLYEMLCTFTGTQDIPSPWMKVKNIIIYIEHCNRCGMSMENIVPEQCTKAALASVGVQCEGDPAYESLADSAMLYSKEVCSKMFVEDISCRTIHPKYFSCPNTGRATESSAPFVLGIDLNNDKRVQNALNDFQRRYTVVSAHAKYFIVKMRGSDSPQATLCL